MIIIILSSIYFLCHFVLMKYMVTKHTETWLLLLHSPVKLISVFNIVSKILCLLCTLRTLHNVGLMGMECDYRGTWKTGNYSLYILNNHLLSSFSFLFENFSVLNTSTTDFTAPYNVNCIIMTNTIAMIINIIERIKPPHQEYSHTHSVKEQYVIPNP